MPKMAGQKKLKIEQAARLIYQTNAPTMAQTSKVRYRLAEGLLQGDAKGEWVSSESVAAFMAARAQKENERRFHGEGRAHLRSNNSEEQLPTIYRQLFRDYFSAVIHRKQPRHASLAFQRAVLVGQLAFILFPIVVLASIWMSATGPPQEQRLVQQFIAEHFQEFQILDWPPAPRSNSGDANVVRVRFKYFEGGSKGVQTDRLYRVNGDRVTEVFDGYD